tara:strand:+ start:2182 stop:2583 length:402 start_codon:yes stop_codon:yes gene_type:complete
MSAERSAEVMRTYLGEVLAKRRFELIPDFVDQEMLDHATGMRGPDALHAHASGFCDNIPDVEIEIEDIFATEDAAFGIWNWKGDPIQSMGTSSNGNPVFPRRVLSVFRLRDGLLIDYEAFVDAGQVRAQISAP